MFKAFRERITQSITKAIAEVKGFFESTKENPISQADEALYQFLKTTKLYIILPIVGIALSVYLLTEYLVYIVLFAVGFWNLIKWLTPVIPTVDHEERYADIRDTLYLALENVSDLLPVRKIQSVIDLVHQPPYVPNRGHAVYLYKLQKTTYEHMNQEQLDFALKIIQAQIDQQLNEYEAFHLDGSTYFNDLRLITVTKILDYGTHYQLQLLWVDDDVTYNTALKQLDKTPVISNIADTKDGDF